MMALSPVSEESPNYELYESDPASRASSYSGESFDSCTDESNGRYKSDAFVSITEEHSERYQSDSFESFAGESSRCESDLFGSSTNESSRNYERDSFESLSSELDMQQTYSAENSYIESVEGDHTENDQGKGLIEKWIKTLVDGNLQPNHSFRHQLKTVAQKESLGNKSEALRSYCSLKIKHLRKPLKGKEKKGKPLIHPPTAVSVQQSRPVPHELMNRLELQCFKETINQVIRTEMHDPAACPDCCSKQAELAQCHFIRLKKTKLESDLLCKKMEEYTYSKDLVTCVGEILQSLPKPSEEPSAVWQKLCTSVMKT